MKSRKFKPEPEAAQQKRQDALDKLTDGIKQLLESGDWQQYLKTQALVLQLLLQQLPANSGAAPSSNSGGRMSALGSSWAATSNRVKKASSFSHQ